MSPTVPPATLSTRQVKTIASGKMLRHIYLRQESTPHYTVQELHDKHRFDILCDGTRYEPYQEKDERHYTLHRIIHHVWREISSHLLYDPSSIELANLVSNGSFPQKAVQCTYF